MRDAIDEIDISILAALQVDSARPVTEIAAEVGLSQAPCWRRIQRLREEGYIRAEVALLDRRKLGFATQFFAQVRLAAHARANLAEFEKAILAHPEVMECYATIGTMDFLLRIVTRDVEHYEDFLMRALSQLPGVQEIQSTLALSEVKSTTALPLAKR